MTIISTAATTTGNAPVLNDATWVREEIRVLREAMDVLIDKLMWDDRFGDCCMQLRRSQLHLLAARDASHRWEGVLHPLQAAGNTTPMPDSNP